MNSHDKTKSRKRKSDNDPAPDVKRKAPDAGNPNEEFSKILIQLSDYEKNVANNMFKAKAYKKAAHTIAGLDYKIKNGTDAMKLPGIGKQIGKKLDEYLATGKLAKIERIEGDDTSTAISLLTRVNGIGPAAARQFLDRGVRKLDDLRKMQDTLTKSQQIGLKYFHEFEERIPRPEITRYRDLVTAALSAYDNDLEFEICGSYRRGKESSFDIDMLMCHPGFTSQLKEPPNKMLKSIVEELERSGLLTDRISIGGVKFMGVGMVPGGHARRVDIRIVPKDRYWCGILYFTGSDIFNQEMRAHALNKKFTLNEYTLRPLGEMGTAGEPLEVTCEKDVFDFLELEYQAPSTRNKLKT